MEAQFRRLGSPRNGYPSIVASGANACILHYIKNRARLNPGDLLLIDAGAEWEFYTADVTRTWPVSGQFTPEQRAVYEIVLEAQRQAIDAVAPGVGIDQAHQVALKVLVQGLVDLGVLTGNVDGLIEDKAYSPYYMHGTSHWLGLDVHDAGVYRQGDTPTELRAGMVLTVEPGLYFGTQAPNSPEHLKGIGIRIEDDVLVTANGRRVLSAAIPKSVADLESLVGTAQG
jgi:Xaa-Pro aminopeptidase